MRFDSQTEYLGIPAFRRGQVVDCPEAVALTMLVRGDAQAELDGPLGNPGQIPPANGIFELRARLAEA